MKTFTVKIGKGPDEMTFAECMTHIKRVLFWDYIDGEWCDVVPLSDKRWEELAGYIRGAHKREVDALEAKNKMLLACLGDGCADCAVGMGEYADSLCDPLKAENTELRYKVHVLEGGNRELKVLYDSVKANNDKLRELVRVAHECKTNDGCCEDCWGDYDECPIEAEMRELGIEVD